MSEAALCYVTCPDADSALLIAQAALEERLAASANILPGATSLYWWRGRIERAAECVLLLKTRTALVEPLTARILALHAYEVPCVVALPVHGGNPAYLAWLEGETEPGFSPGG